ncbi:hypothetical protein HP436_08260 [Pseudomonas sp. CrR14]|nr:hypothetical protein [Pseudomonas sp. CrR14]
MKKIMISLAVLIFHSSAYAAIPKLSASCPGGIEVLADEGGPVYINGVKGALKQFSDNYFEIKEGDVVISLMTAPDGSIDVSYTGKHKAHGVCSTKSS